MITIKFSKTLPKTADTLIVPVTTSLKIGGYGGVIDKNSKGFLKRALKVNDGFKGKNGETLLTTLPNGAGMARVLFVGLGDAKKLSALTAETAGGKVLKAAKALKTTHVALASAALPKSCALDADQTGAHMLNGAALRSYDFEDYRKKSNAKDKSTKLKTLTYACGGAMATKKHYAPLSAVSAGTCTARDLVNEPPNTLYPDSYAKRIAKLLRPLGVDVEIIDDKKMQKLGMGAAMAVGKGSERKPRMVIMRYNGGKAALPKKQTKTSKDKPLVFVGKGVTFDTGGISLKPGASMDEMKMDMGGSAAVVGLMQALATRKTKANVVGIVGLAENMPAHNAYRPGDIIKSYSGKTIEVLNTDAEGRLVLADALAYIQDLYTPKFIIDLATLTGAMMVALGHEYCGSFVNDDKLWSGMEDASKTTGEKLWRMPLDTVWSKEMESHVADLRNLGKSRYGGACTAAGFLEHFIKDGTSWAHMDIAGTAWRKSEQATCPKDGTGFGVRVLNQLVKDHYEG